MAEVIVSTIVEQLVSILHQQLEGRVKLVVGVDEQVQELTSTFQALGAVLNDAESRQMKESSVRDWLDKLKDTSYDIDDVLDEWSTMIQKLQTMEMEDACTPLIKVCSQISCYRFCYKRVVISHDIAVKIRDLNKKLDFVAHEKDKFNFSLGKGTGQLENQITTSVIDITETHGRNHDKNKVKNLLLSENSNRTTSLPIISIVGMGGLGKTTLARLVFNDNEVKDHFQEKIWVFVSIPFDEVRIAKAILESLMGVEPKLVEYQTVLKQLQELIKERKFLLVLDDVWTEGSSKWEQLKNSLKCGAKGSRILVTTRKKNVAEVLETTDLVELEMLSDEHCWTLFNQLSLCGKNKEECNDVGRKIVGKCKGLPLAVKSLGNLLRSKKTLKEWQNVLNGEMQEEVEKEIFPPLLLSYYDLTIELKKCFLYCAIFPSDYVIEKDQLIELWMAQDYLKKKQSDDDMELVGEKCFKGLVIRSFFQDLEKSDYDGSIIRCKMHPIMHGLAQFLTKNECFTIESGGLKKSQLESPFKARHAMIRIKEGAAFPTSIFRETKLRSLLIDSESWFEIDPYLRKLFNQMTCLRSLNLSCTLLEALPSGIERLIHLRYLNLSSNGRLQKLPETLCFLYNLLTLNISNCWRLQKLPEEIGRLLKLRHLINYRTGTEKFVDMPKGFERLTCLRTLNKIVVTGDIQTCGFECLRNLNHLQGSLDIECRDQVDVREINNAEFNNKESLYGLRLEFWDALNEEAFEVFQPPPYLENLNIERYKGNPTSLKWMESLTKPRKLCLQDWENLERLPSLGKLPSLETLSISYFSSVKRVHNEFLGTESGDSSTSSSSVVVFPKLQSLEFSYMNNWEEWGYGGGAITIMPRLRYLSISYCNKLKTLPDYLRQLTMLDELKICSCPQLNGKTDLEMSRVTRVHNEFLGIESDGMSSVVAFPKLQSLEFRDMGNWEEWDYKTTRSGREDITIMPCLLSLTIWNCLKLKSVPDYLMKLTTLKELNAENYRIVGHYQWETAKDLVQWKTAKDLVENLNIPRNWICQNLIGLSLDFEGVNSKGGVEAFKPPPNLENLKIKCYNNNLTTLNWMESLTKLTEVSLENCGCLPPLGKLLFLERLYINGSSVVKVGNEFLGIESGSTSVSSSSSIILFPKLLSLEFTNMKNWEKWDFTKTKEGLEDIKIMPCLRSLRIKECPELSTLPEYLLQLTTLKEFDTEDCPILDKRYRKVTVKDSGMPIRIIENPSDDSKTFSSSGYFGKLY
ncbi:hypothetical protein JRO89_XS09G0174000 [Xanthoceras sorbifolium]|uniref:Uncharacterized protein n=1 Tax=Xanthoceras sorbifolium TaxID=99658 RepID=A0ABQ8HLN6_9ROSI|nr:hypothetical protein JRO89_XS09G0174000 [Xanthoceras sorbifolium]